MLGDKLGLFDGEALGDEVGNLLGNRLGLFEGDELGDALGNWLGLEDGDALGAVGVELGDELGDWLGLFDGLTVGRFVLQSCDRQTFTFFPVEIVSFSPPSGKLFMCICT